MPLSLTEKAMTWPALPSCSLPGLQPASARETLNSTPPEAVNLKAFDSRFLITC